MIVTRHIALAAVAALALAACSSPAPVDGNRAASPAAESLLTTYDLAGLDGREIVDQLERTPVDERPTSLMASVRAGELLLSDASTDEPTAVELPADEFYLSVAPYVAHTHDCYFHSLTTCLGELAGENIQVTITDQATGDVLVDETTSTFDNGFIAYWLPSGIDAVIEVEYGELVGTQHISTGPDDPTCLTTLQLT